MPMHPIVKYGLVPLDQSNPFSWCNLNENNRVTGNNTYSNGQREEFATQIVQTINNIDTSREPEPSISANGYYGFSPALNLQLSSLQHTTDHDIMDTSDTTIAEVQHCFGTLSNREMNGHVRCVFQDEIINADQSWRRKRNHNGDNGYQSLKKQRSEEIPAVPTDDVTAHQNLDNYPRCLIGHYI